MDKILSQDEINALFSSMTSGGVIVDRNGAEAPERSVTRYDFCRSDRISKDQIRSIHLLHSFFARNYSSSLSAYLRAIVEVNLASVEQITYGDFLKLLSDPTLFCSITMEPMRGNMAMELSPSLVFPMIDMLLGGPGSPVSGNRTLTEIEMHIVEGIIKLTLHDLKEAWRSVMEVNPRLVGSETKPQMLRIVAPGEAVVAIGFEVNLGENTGMLNFCIPSVMLKVNRTRFDQHWQSRPGLPEDGSQGRMQALLRNSSIPLCGEMRGNRLRVEDLVEINIGDVIQLKQSLDEPLVLTVGGVPKFMGRVKVRRGKKIFEISHKYES